MNKLNICKERFVRGERWMQEYVRQQVGVTKQSIHDIETGRQKPSYDVPVKLENLFDNKHTAACFAQAGDSQPLRL